MPRGRSAASPSPARRRSVSKPKKQKADPYASPPAKKQETKSPAASSQRRSSRSRSRPRVSPSRSVSPMSPTQAEKSGISPFVRPLRSELAEYQFNGLKLADGSPTWYSRSMYLSPRDGSPASSTSSSSAITAAAAASASAAAAAGKGAAERRQVTLLRAPLRTMAVFGRVTTEKALQGARYLGSHHALLGALLFLSVLLCAVHAVDGPHQAYLPVAHRFVAVAITWIGLGVASSIGMGTGLHTFVLFLGPHIARVTMAAVECGTLALVRGHPGGVDLDIDLIGGSYTCPPEPYERHQPGLKEIFAHVWIDCFMWGAGTALGELPPYFIARAAREAGQHLAELDEVEKLETSASSSLSSLVDRGKVFVYEALQWGAFPVVLVMASVPNPLFDLAGLACGHFGVSFWTFFTATFIGKAVFKVALQAVVVVAMFSSTHLDVLVRHVGDVVPALGKRLGDALAAQKAAYHGKGGAQSAGPSTFAYLWDAFLIVMVGSFVVSIINSTVQGRLAQEEAQRARRRPQLMAPYVSRPVDDDDDDD